MKVLFGKFCLIALLISAVSLCLSPTNSIARPEEEIQQAINELRTSSIDALQPEERNQQISAQLQIITDNIDSLSSNDLVSGLNTSLLDLFNRSTLHRKKIIEIALKMARNPALSVTPLEALSSTSPDNTVKETKETVVAFFGLLTENILRSRNGEISPTTEEEERMGARLFIVVMTTGSPVIANAALIALNKTDLLKPNNASLIIASLSRRFNNGFVIDREIVESIYILSTSDDSSISKPALSVLNTIYRKALKIKWNNGGLSSDRAKLQALEAIKAMETLSLIPTPKSRAALLHVYTSAFPDSDPHNPGDTIRRNAPGISGAPRMVEEAPTGSTLSEDRWLERIVRAISEAAQGAESRSSKRARRGR